MKRVAYLAAFAIVSGLGIVGCDRSDQANNTAPNANPPGQATANKIQNAADKTGNALNDAAHNTGEALGTATTRTADLAQKAGDTVTGNSTDASTVAPDASGIRDGMARVVNDSVTKDNFSALVKDFTTASQNRIGDFSKQDFADLDAVVAQIQTDWNTKYGHDFKCTSEALTNDSITIRQGAYAASGNVPRSNESGIGTAAADANTGVVSFATRNGKTLTIPVAKQGVLRDWYIDTPSTLTGQKLHDNLVRELTAVKDAQANWPSDQNEAYRVVAGHVLAAVMDTPAK